MSAVTSASIVSPQSAPAARRLPTMKPREFLATVLPTGGVCVAFHRESKRSQWFDTTDELAEFLARVNAEPGWYYATAAFSQRQRKQADVRAKRCFYFDIDCGPDKHAKDPDGTYKTATDAVAALVEFSRATRVAPTLVISSGAGLHVYYVVRDDMAADDWLPLARGLGALAKAKGLRVDPSCTTDSSRLLRPLGALHQNGNRVELLKATGRIYTLDELRELVPTPAPFDSAAIGRQASDHSRAKLDVNAGLKMFEPTPTSALKVAEKCAALRRVAETGGDVPEPYWRAMIGVVKFCVEGADIAHEWSRGYEGYSEDETQAKYDAYAGTGPTTCETFAKYNSKACAACEYNGKLTSPVSLGRLKPETVAAQAGQAATSGEGALPQWLQDERARFAFVRQGADFLVADECAEVASGTQLRRATALFSIRTYRALRANVHAPEAPGKSVADLYLRSAHRREYAAAAFAPGEKTDPRVLNLWTGWGVDPSPGDIAPWLRTLEGLISDPAVRAFAHKWLAWKVQNPGGVPGTVLVVSGKKGTGKNSLFEPIVRAFGAHGKVFDDADQVVGRFTGHLQTTAFAVLDEALFTGNPQQGDRIKARVTASTCTYETKGLTPVSGVNRAAFVSISNHLHVWSATDDERRAVIIEASDTLRGNGEHWRDFYRWIDNQGCEHLLHHLQTMPLGEFNPRIAPRTAALSRQVEMTVLKAPDASWWHTALLEGRLPSVRGGAIVELRADQPTDIPVAVVRESWAEFTRRGEQGWPSAARSLHAWVPNLDMKRPRGGADEEARARVMTFPPLAELRSAFAKATGVHIAVTGTTR